MTRHAPRTPTFAETIAAMSARELRDEADALTHRYNCVGSHPLTVRSVANRRDIEARLRTVQVEMDRRGQL